MLDFLPALTKNLTSANRRTAEGKDGKKVTVRTSDLTEALTFLGLLMVENARLKQSETIARRAAEVSYFPAHPAFIAAITALLCLCTMAATLFVRAHLK